MHLTEHSETHFILTRPKAGTMCLVPKTKRMRMNKMEVLLLDAMWEVN